MPVNVPVDDPNADTEWNDILRSKGIIPEKPPSPTPIIEEALVAAQKRAHEDRLEDKGLEELDELEDDEDEVFLQKYRQQRLAELSDLQKLSIHNQVYPIQKPDYAKDVTDASSKYFVCVLLTSSLGTNIESGLLTEIWRELAKKYGNIKFCEMKADLCIEGYPERNTPTVLVYHKGEIIKQLVTLRHLKGAETKFEDLESVLVDVKAIEDNDIRLRRKGQISRSEKDIDSQVGRADDYDDDDDDWN